MYSEKLLLSLNSTSAFASCGASLLQAKEVLNIFYFFLYVNAVYKKHKQISTYSEAQGSEQIKLLISCSLHPSCWNSCSTQTFLLFFHKTIHCTFPSRVADTPIKTFSIWTHQYSCLNEICFTFSKVFFKFSNICSCLTFVWGDEGTSFFIRVLIHMQAFLFMTLKKRMLDFIP